MQSVPTKRSRVVHGPPFLALLLALSAFAPDSSWAVQYSPGYVYDMEGRVARDAAGHCRRTSKWTPANALEACDPDVVEERAQDTTIRPEIVRVTGVEADVELTTLQSGEAFGFGSAVLSEAGKATLAEAVASRKDDYIHRVNVVGYTDRIGDPQYNLTLSQRRAEAVKTELVALGVPAERIRTTAAGSTDPVVTCEGVTGKALIACLAPNRRTAVSFTVPRITTSAVAELVSARRQSEIKSSNITVVETAVDTPLISRGFNDAMKLMGDGCSKEIADLCSDVELGGGRMLACLNGHSRDLSDGCHKALADAMIRVDAALGDANFFGAKCARDLKEQCADIEPGQGEALNCLTGNIKFVTKRCVDALLELGLIDASQYPFRLEAPSQR
jgi:OOP family OmpA-OmpF porin